jgi:hypothetical protein
MTDSTNNQPPPHVAAAAKIVDEWLRGQPGVLDVGKPQPQRPETAAERFKRTPRSDTPAPQPPWKDPRVP